MERQNISKLLPGHAIHPGLILSKELNKIGMKQREFANEIGLAPTQINEIIKGKRNISAETALLFQASLDVDAVFWLNLQSIYDIDTVRKDEGFKERTETLMEWKTIKTLIPYSFLKKEKIITDDKEKDIKTILNFYNVGNIEGLRKEVKIAESYRFKKSSTRQVNNVNLAGWVKYVKYQARNKKVKPFKEASREKLITELKGIFLKENVLDNIEKTLKRYGIILIVQQKLDKVPVDGFATWGEKNPIVAVSLRYKRLDNLAFTLFHEIAHVYLHLIHDKEGIFLDDIDANGSKVKEEVEANTFAENNLISRNDWTSFLARNHSFSSETIKRFSKEIGTHPAVTLGRLKKEYNEYYRRRFTIPNEII